MVESLCHISGRREIVTIGGKAGVKAVEEAVWW